MKSSPVRVDRTAEYPALRTRDLAVGYRVGRTRRPVLEHLDLEAPAGALVCLLGPNGIGKSTLLRTLARMQPALSGTVEVDGVDIRSMSQGELARHLGVVLTERVSVESLPARRLVELGRYPHSGWFGQLSERDLRAVESAIDVVGARHLAARDFGRLSDGERQRVMIARALAQEPALLVLDEPTAFLDVPSRVEVMGLLRQLTREAGLAVIVSTHDLELALRTADVVWIVLPGRDVVAGAPEDLVLSGAIAQAFEGRTIRFHPTERRFRCAGGDRGRAVVEGTDLRAAMVRAVLEREGFEALPGPADPDALEVEVFGEGWRVSSGRCQGQGADCASLASFLRRMSELGVRRPRASVMGTSGEDRRA